jgi:hypothetical protein
VCLLDLRNKTDEVIERGLDDFYFLSPPPLGDDLVFLILSLKSYTGLLHWEDLAPEAGPAGIQRIPYLECWYPTDLLLSFIHRALFVHVLQGNDNSRLLDLERPKRGKATSNFSIVSRMLDDSVSTLYKRTLTDE